jgi:hypothetical protein
MRYILWRHVRALVISLATASLVIWLPLAGLARAGKMPAPPGAMGAASFPLEVSGTHYVYVDNGAAPNSVSGYQATRTGLTPLPGSPYPTGGDGSSAGYAGNQLAISPDHQCVFAVDDGGGTSGPTAMTQIGCWLLVTNEGDSTISPCKVGPGRLTCVAPIYLPVPGSPNGIASF